MVTGLFHISICLCAVKLDQKWTKNQVKVIHHCPPWNNISCSISYNMCVSIWSSGINNFNNVKLIGTFYLGLNYMYFVLTKMCLERPELAFINEPMISLNMLLSSQQLKYLCRMENVCRNVLMKAVSQEFIEESYFNVFMTNWVVEY